jgi:hypothetical protein
MSNPEPMPVVQAQVPEPEVKTAIDELWDKAEAELQKEKDWSAFQAEFRKDPSNSGTLSMENILARFEELKTAKDDEKWAATTIRGKAIRPRDVFDKIVGYAREFKDLGAALAKPDPTQSASLAWGILQFFVTVRRLPLTPIVPDINAQPQLAVKNQEIRDLVDNHERVASLMYRSAIYAKLYLDTSAEGAAFKCRPLMEESLSAVYASILKYFMVSWKFLEQNKWRASTPLQALHGY